LSLDSWQAYFSFNRVWNWSWCSTGFDYGDPAIVVKALGSRVTYRFNKPSSPCAGDFEVKFGPFEIRTEITPEFSPNGVCGDSFSVNVDVDIPESTIDITNNPPGCGLVTWVVENFFMDTVIDQIEQGVYDTFSEPF